MLASNKMAPNSTIFLKKTLRRLGAKTIAVVHYFIVFFVVFGSLASSKKALWVHCLSIPLMIIHWKTNQDKCVLTDIENALNSPLDDNAHPCTGEPNGGNENNSFVKRLLSYFLNPLPSDKQIKKLLYSTIWLSWSITVIKLTLW